ncbi:HelD family protein [Paractinoplanes globisporus]|uniref:HelD family protein n=1 Tax=Paractinoplanes globisporus TaxID=113565 RepID=A0ABW6WQK0_9ACTN|nr:ATP-binding domain-containing protein [Actinoplanes globisporus]
MFRQADPGAPADDDLLADLGREQAATIRAAQDDLVRAPLDRLLIIQGGPGTGKTMTALRRVAWLLDEGLLDDAETLVVGPSVAFARYTDDILTGWGYDRVEHRPVTALLPRVATVVEQPPHVTRLKGEARMARLLARAFEERPGLPSGELSSSIDIGGRTVNLDPVALKRVIDTARASEASPGDRRILLRATLAAGSRDPRLVLEAADRLAERLWPSLDPQGFLRELFASRELLASAAGGEFTDREIESLYRPADDHGWDEADRPLLDEAAHLIDGDPKGFGHVVLDEAQDLSPMQLRAICRRSATGSMTVIGDIAQSTGPWARDDWNDLVAQLPSAQPHEHRELRFGYRIPRQIFDLAAELLPMAAPSVPAPTTVRDSSADPVIVPAEPADRGSLVAAAAAGHAEQGRTVAVICPARCRDEIIAGLDAEGLTWHTAGEGPGIALLAPHEAKGLEFDAAVVVEPGHILDDDPRGHRLLYIALTRSTSHLHLIGAPEDLPIEQPPPVFRELVEEVSAEPAPPVEVELDAATQETINMVVQSLAETLLGTLTPELWPVAMNRLEQLINPEA